MPEKTLILGSSSPYRRELLGRLHLGFDTRSPEVDETRRPDEPPEILVRRLAEAKARACARPGEAALIIGSDQVAVCGDEVLGKPGGHAAACAQLGRLSGRSVRFLTGLCLLDSRSGEAEVECIPFEVDFRDLSEAEIRRYVEAEQPYNCAGSFKSEGLGITLFAAMRGEDPTALIGLPLIRLAAMLRRAGLALP